MKIRASLPRRRESRFFGGSWIPAFAGMTFGGHAIGFSDHYPLTTVFIVMTIPGLEVAPTNLKTL